MDCHDVRNVGIKTMLKLTKEFYKSLPLAMVVILTSLLSAPRTAGANVNVKDKDGNTPLHNAVRAGHKGIVDFLIAHGADAGMQDKKGRTVLNLAEQTRGRAEIVELLRKHAAKKLASGWQRLTGFSRHLGISARLSKDTLLPPPPSPSNRIGPRSS